MSGGDGSNAISHRHLDRVHIRIEQCLKHYLTKKETMEALCVQDNIQPRLTELIWERLEQENPEFFKFYYPRSVLKDHIYEFNRLLAQQVQLMDQLGLTGTTDMLPSNGSHVSLTQQVPTPYAAQNARPQQGENMNFQHPSVFNNRGSSVQPCVQGTINESLHGRNFDVSRSLMYTQNSNMGSAQRPNGNMGLAQRPNGNMGLAQRPNGNMGLAQRPNGNMGLAQRPNKNMGLVQRPNGNMELAQRPNGNMGLAQRPNTNMGLVQRPNGNMELAQRPNGNMGLVQRRNENVGLAQSPNMNLGLPQRPNGNMGLAQRPDENMGLAQRANANMGLAQRAKANMGLAQTMNKDMGLARTMDWNNVNTEAYHVTSNNLEPCSLVGDACMSSSSNVESNAQHNSLLDGDASSLGCLPQIPHPSQWNVDISELFASCWGPFSMPTEAGDFVDPQGDVETFDPASENLP